MSFASRTLLILALAPALSLAGCGGDKTKNGKADPPLADQIKVDPALIGKSGGSAVSASGGAKDAATARAEAVALMGGTAAIKPLPALESGAERRGSAATITAAAKAATTSSAGAKCAALVEYAPAWANRMPQPFPVYPRSVVAEAAGTDANGCGLRVVTFTTPVMITDVLTFYYTRALTAGYSAGRGQQDGDEILAGVKGGASFTVHARPTAAGGSEVDLITSQ